MELPPGHPDLAPDAPLDRCTRDCGRRGVHLWRLTTGRELTFCGPCNGRHELALLEQGAVLVRSVPVPA